MSDRMVCWPKLWVDAVVEAGLAIKKDDCILIIGGDEMRDKLQKFADAITVSCEDNI